jgi:hypothetical protein
MRLTCLLACLTLALSTASAEVTRTRIAVVDHRNEGQFPLPDYLGEREFRTMSMAPNGVVGMLFRDVVDVDGVDRMRITIAERLPSDEIRKEVILDTSASNVKFEPVGSLVYDEFSRPHVFRESGGKIHVYQRGEGAWFEAASAPLSNGMLRTALNDPQGNIHAIYSARASDNLQHLYFATMTSSGLSHRDCGPMSVLDRDGFDYIDFFDFAVDGNGALHVCFESSEPFGDPENLPRGRMNWGKWEGSGWTIETVRQGDNVDDKPAWNGAMAVDYNGVPHVLSTHTTHSDTGSMKTSKLYYYTRSSPGSWNRELIAESADGYVGGDGNKYSGEYPCLTFDRNNNPHVTFADIASWHWHCIPELPDISCNDQIRGQVRYAWKEGSSWKTYTVYAQEGQSESAEPLHLMAGHRIVSSPGGRYLHFMAMEHNHFSNTYPYDQDAMKLFRVYYFQVENTRGTDPSGTTGDIIERLLGFDIPTTGMDLTGDGIIDVGDVIRSIQ